MRIIRAFIFFNLIFHITTFGSHYNLVDELLGLQNIRPGLEQRLQTVKEEFHIFNHKRLKYRHATLALHGTICKFSKEPPIYYICRNRANINCEHVVPQSFFHYIPVIAADLHNMFISDRLINEFRGNCKFANLPDTESIPFFTCKISQRGDLFEPNNESKGKIARACAYFFTRYTSFLPKMSQVIDIDTMITWHEMYPPNRSERRREKAIFRVQKNHNPYITQPVSYMRQVWLDN